MLADYFESLIGEYVPVPNQVGFFSVNWHWAICAIFFIVSFHCVMLILISVLRRIIQK